MARYMTKESEPFGRWKGIPIYLTTILTAVMVLGLIVSAILMSAQSPLLNDAVFHAPRANWGNLVAVFTYPWVGKINFFTLFGIVCFYMWSVGIETHMGRATLSKLLILIIGTPPVVALGIWHGFGVPGALAQGYLLSAGLVIAFATLYPNVLVFGLLPFKYAATFCLACGVFMEIGDRNWTGLTAILASAAVAFFYMRIKIEEEQDDTEPVFAKLRAYFRRKPKLRVLPSPPRPTRSIAHDEERPDIAAESDAILEKVAKHGVNSLTPRERAILEKARQELIRRDGK